mmetsp:Transcript_48414/g.122227  ORF Transcript_48414/g.122227 Transcript_48414/m.122227 type:complete len:204 (+) Transcript_48414:542-1153(+)
MRPPLCAPPRCPTARCPRWWARMRQRATRRPSCCAPLRPRRPAGWAAFPPPLLPTSRAALLSCNARGTPPQLPPEAARYPPWFWSLVSERMRRTAAPAIIRTRRREHCKRPCCRGSPSRRLRSWLRSRAPACWASLSRGRSRSWCGRWRRAAAGSRACTAGWSRSWRGAGTAACPRAMSPWRPPALPRRSSGGRPSSPGWGAA